jgi:CRP/FNR family transcriptional regulator
MQVEGPGGSRIILRLVKPVEFICGMGLFSDNRNQFSLRAVSRSSVCYIDKEHFKEILQKNKTFMEAFLGHIEVFQARNLQKMINLGQKHSGGRIAEALLYLSKEVYESDSFDSDLSTTELSELSGTSKESTFKVLSDFSNQGILIREGSQFSIKDRILLEKVSKNG